MGIIGLCPSCLMGREKWPGLGRFCQSASPRTIYMSARAIPGTNGYVGTIHLSFTGAGLMAILDKGSLFLNLGEKHNLEVIDILNDDATLNSFGLHYKGKDRFVVRKEISVAPLYHEVNIYLCDPSSP